MDEVGGAFDDEEVICLVLGCCFYTYVGCYLAYKLMIYRSAA